VRPRLELLDRHLIDSILGEAFELIEKLGVRVSPYVFELLSSAGARIEDGVAHIPDSLARKTLATAPHEFFLYDRNGRSAVLKSISIQARPASTSSIRTLSRRDRPNLWTWCALYKWRKCCHSMLHSQQH